MAGKIVGPIFTGRGWDEYLKMFNLTEEELMNKSILDCAAGASSFTRYLAGRGGEVRAVDLLYDQDPLVLRSLCQEHLEALVKSLEPLKKEFEWSYFQDLADLKEHRRLSCQEFYHDYSQHPDRYLWGDLTRLPFADGEYDLVLSSHLLFIYDHRLDLEFHILALEEMCRVGQEVRIYPLVKRKKMKSEFLKPVWERLSGTVKLELVKVDYQFRRGGDQMLVIKKMK
ncbi:MAG: class I SAM-dependent methyltransferase [Methanobacteriaceae archaeon]